MIIKVQNRETNYILYASSFLFMINIISTVYNAVSENLLSFLIFNLFFIIIGILLIISFKKDNYKNSIFIFSIFTLIYGFNFLLQFYLNDTWNIYKDETLFFKYTNDVALLISKGSTFFDLMSDIKYSAMVGYIHLAGLIALISNYIDQNSILVQKIFIVYISAFNSVLLYNMVLKYFSKTNALYLAILFSSLSFMMLFSSVLLRDQLVAFFYLLFFIVFLQDTSVKNSFLLMLIIFFSILVRPETGLFLIVFYLLYLIYIFISIKQKQLKIIFLIIIMTMCLLSSIYYIDKIFLLFNQTAFGYSSLVRDQASSSSFGLVLYNLPYGLNYIALTAFWQLQPFPFWSVFARDLMNPIAGIQYALAGFFWYLVVGILVVGILKFKLIKIIDKKLLLLFIGSVIYIILISSIAPDVRRLMAVYPVIYIVSSYGFIYFMNNRKIYVALLFFLYILLIVFYIMLKGFVI
jgi:hypothetical protein